MLNRFLILGLMLAVGGCTNSSPPKPNPTTSTTPKIPGPHTTVVWVSIDGFRHDYLDRFHPPEMTKLARPMGEYLRQNVHYTFGGFNFPATFQDLLAEVGVARIMFSVDYPYGSMTEARTFLEQLPVSTADRERIAHGNAEQLLGL